jgi:predicted metal-dependent phosphoesterase TrpH
VTRSRIEPLLAELHTHTTWSDGVLTIAQLVDLYGNHGFDLLCVTDHVIRRDDPCLTARGEQGFGVTASRFPQYLAEIESAAAVALERYGMLVLPGLELTYNDPDPSEAAHAVAVGLDRFVSVDLGIDQAIMEAAGAGAALIAAHPMSGPDPSGARQPTCRFARDAELRSLVHRFELFNRHDLFAWVAGEGLPTVASGDFHRPDHLWGWKTLLPCRRNRAEVVAYLRSRRPAYLTRLDRAVSRLAA